MAVAMAMVVLLLCWGIHAEERRTKGAEIRGSAAEDYSYNDFSFCLLPSAIPPPSTPFTAFLTFTFSTPPQYCNISFLQMDESNLLYMGEQREVEQVGESTVIEVAIHEAESDLLGFNSQLLAEFAFVVGSLRTSSHLLSVSLSFRSPSFVPLFAGVCPNTADLPFQMFPFLSNVADVSVPPQSEANLEEVRNHQKSESSSSETSGRNNDIVIVFSFVFAVVIGVSCLASAYVIAASIRNDPLRKPNNQTRLDDHADTDDDHSLPDHSLPEREFLV